MAPQLSFEQQVQLLSRLTPEQKQKLAEIEGLQRPEAPSAGDIALGVGTKLGTNLAVKKGSEFLAEQIGAGSDVAGPLGSVAMGLIQGQDAGSIAQNVGMSILKQQLLKQGAQQLGISAGAGAGGAGAGTAGAGIGSAFGGGTMGAAAGTAALAAPVIAAMAFQMSRGSKSPQTQKELRSSPKLESQFPGFKNLSDEEKDKVIQRAVEGGGSTLFRSGKDVTKNARRGVGLDFGSFEKALSGAQNDNQRQKRAALKELGFTPTGFDEQGRPQFLDAKERLQKIRDFSEGGFSQFGFKQNPFADARLPRSIDEVSGAAEEISKLVGGEPQEAPQAKPAQLTPEQIQNIRGFQDKPQDTGFLESLGPIQSLPGIFTLEGRGNHQDLGDGPSAVPGSLGQQAFPSESESTEEFQSILERLLASGAKLTPAM